MTSYALRFTERAGREIAEARAYLAEHIGDSAANRWEADLVAAIAALSTLPGARPIAPESKHFPGLTVRQMLYRRTRGGAAFRVLFATMECAEEGPLVLIFHVRYAARRPITPKEARQMAADLP